MRLLFTGRGTSGSWQIRGVQMAQALGAAAVPHRSLPDLRRFDMVVAVKRVPDSLLDALRRSGRPWVWDVVDAYPQPECSHWTREQSIDWVRGRLAFLKPTAVIWPNARMRDDCAEDGQGLVLYHHHWPKIVANPIRQRIHVIGYEGATAYLAEWQDGFARAASKIGAVFDPKIRQLSDCDVVIATRGGQQDCYSCRSWKSNVKLANAHGSGTPFIGQADAGYTETAAGEERWIESPDQIGRALESLVDQSFRRVVSEQFLAKAIPLDSVANQLKTFLERVK